MYIYVYIYIHIYHIYVCIYIYIYTRELRLPCSLSHTEPKRITTGFVKKVTCTVIVRLLIQSFYIFLSYPARDYFILDHIETASLRAILVTAFLQLWCLNTTLGPLGLGCDLGFNWEAPEVGIQHTLW